MEKLSKLLKLKKGAKLMIIMNLDMVDGHNLYNGRICFFQGIRRE